MLEIFHHSKRVSIIWNIYEIYSFVKKKPMGSSVNCLKTTSAQKKYQTSYNPYQI